MTIPINLPKRTNIQGLWHLEEESGIRIDESINENTLQDNNTVLFGAGKIGNAADFENDNSEYLSIADGVQVGLDITGEITILTWIKPETMNTIDIVLGRYDYGNNQRAYRMQIGSTNSNVTAMLSPDGTAFTSAVSASDVVSNGTLVHIGFTLNQTTNKIQIYVDGVASGAAVDYATDIHNSTAPFAIGCIYNDDVATYFFDGLVDEPIVWNTCLTAEEVLAVKNITAYQYGQPGNFFIFLSKAYRRGKKYFKEKGLYLPNDRLYEPEILIPEGI